MSRSILRSAGDKFFMGVVFFALVTFSSSARNTIATEASSKDISSRLDVALALKNEGQFLKSIKEYEAVIGKAHRARESEIELNCLKELGILYWNIGNLHESKKNFDKALILSRELKDLESISFISSSLSIYDLYIEGKKLRTSENYKEAIERFSRAIDLSKSINSDNHLIKCQRLLSLVYWDMGDFNNFFLLNSNALSLATLTKNKRELSSCLNNIGAYYIKADYYSKAIQCCEEALSVAEENGDAQGITDSLSNLGIIYQELGQFDKAIDCTSRSLKIDMGTGDIQQISADFINRGTIFRKRGLASNSYVDFENALSDFNSAMNFANQAHDPQLEIAVLNNIGAVLSDQGRYSEALTNFAKAFELSEKARDKEKASRILNNLGVINLKLGRLEDSTSYFQRAIKIASQRKDEQVLWEAYFEFANTYVKQKKFKDALGNFKKSISLIEDIRSSINIEDLKASYLGTGKRIEVYQNLIDVLVTLHQEEPSKGYDKEAFNYLERAKARAFLDSLEVSEVDVSQGINPVLLNHEKEAMRDISRAYKKLLAEGLSPEDKEKVSEQIKNSEDNLEALKREIRITSPAYADLKYPSVITYDEVRRNLISTAEAYLCYSVGKESGHAFVISRKGLKIFDLPARNILQKQVIEYRKAIGDHQNNDFHLGRELFQELVSPGLEPGVKKLMIVPDDVLNFLPFETLLTTSDPGSWLIRDYSIGYVPSLSSLRVLQQRRRNGATPHRDLLAIGDTTSSNGQRNQRAPSAEFYYDPGSAQPINLSPLKFSALEIQNISGLFRANKVQVLRGQNATERSLKSQPLADFKIVHFATHSIIDDLKPARSAIVLSYDENQGEDGLLQTRDIYNLKLNADLVTLSACQTGLGQYIRGEGIEGLSRAFFYAGSSSVLMSLWSVNDQATDLLMERFYRHIKKSESLMEALRRAKLEMIASKGLSHPYYWAGFVVNGKANTQIFSGNFSLVIFLTALFGTGMLLFLSGLAYRHTKV